MLKKNQIKLLSGTLLIVISIVGYQFFQASLKSENSLKIGVTTDAQAYSKKNKETGEWEVNWRIKGALERFVEKMNEEFKPDVVVDIGDFVDGKDHRSYKSWEQAEEIFKKLKVTVYYVLGNHETGRFVKEKWLELTGYNNTYYYKDIEKGKVSYRLIMLDTNYTPEGEDTSPDKRYYPGYINEEQWEWLENLLQESKEQDKDILVFVHHPPVNVDAWPNWGIFPQGEKIQELFKKYEVRAVFSGHIEQMCFERNERTEYFVLQGLWKSKSHLKERYQFKNAGTFYYVIITPDDIIVKAEYRVFKDGKRKKKNISGWTNTLVNDNEDYDCRDGHQLVE